MSHVIEIGAPTDRAPLDAPVRRVMLLEDRAEVRRVGAIELRPGLNRLVVQRVAPVMHDLSLRGESSTAGAQVVDTRVHRALRVLRSEAPEQLAALDAEINRLAEICRAQEGAYERAVESYLGIGAIARRAMQELPEDVAWGLDSTERWAADFSALFERGRALVDRALDTRFAHADADEALDKALARRRAAERPDLHTVAHVELDVLVTGEAPLTAELALVYTVPGALWRPMHRARLSDGTLEVTSRAAVWQHTGEDWVDVELAASTARSAAETEPPLLDDDLLEAERRAETTSLSAREVEVQSTGPAGAKPTTAVELPGVDDGGEVRHLVAPHPVTVRSDGRLHVVDLARFTAPASQTRVLQPELDPAVHVRVDARNRGAHPLLAGPVELVGEHGIVGHTETVFVAPGAPFDLGFGPDDALRCVRTTQKEKWTDEVDQWTRRARRVVLYLSNLSDTPRAIEITERVPVSEVEEVRITIDPQHTDGPTTVDANGFWTTTRTLPAHGQTRITLRWVMATAPGVEL